MAAGIIELCDQVVALIEAEWEPGLPNQVERVYVAPATVEELASLTGRKVYVFPGRKLTKGATDRECDAIDWSVGILCIERYTDAGLLPKEWMDQRVEWQEDVVEYAIDYDGREGWLEFNSRQLRTMSIETEVYDVDKHEEFKLYWSETEVIFEEPAAET